MSGMLLLCAVAGVSSCAIQRSDSAASNARDANALHVEIRRTTDGVPHIEAATWTGLGFGDGYAQASDALCTMAESYLTYRGERARYFGPDAKPDVLSTFGRPTNLDSDFFFKLLDTDAVVAQYKSHQPPEIAQLIDGFTRGYNRYVRELKAGQWPEQAQACRNAPWLTEITETDVYKRLYAANLAGGAADFVSAIANAQPPSPTPLASVGSLGSLASGDAMQRDRSKPLATGHASMQASEPLDRKWFQAGGIPGLGSNGIAFGGKATENGSPLLFGNPHWFWRGPDRFYQAQLTIPGQIDVSGASFLGVPVVMIGFNRSIAWTHTVSAARRFGVFQLRLDATSPTTYLYDGKPESMTPVTLKVDVLNKDGRVSTKEKTFYTTRFGPLINLGTMSPALKWDDKQAFALRDVNAANFQIFQNFLEWGKAQSLDDFIRIQKRYAAMPWVNTIAIGRNDSRVWFADIGAVPNVPDTLAARCTTPQGKAFGKSVPGVPFLDGSRSDCNWMTSAGSVLPGTVAPDAMPQLLRQDYVANMNNSYWLANPDAPLTGFPAVFGAAPEPLTLRPRLGYTMIRQRLDGSDGYPGNKATSETVRALALNSRVLSAELFKSAILRRVCTAPQVTVARDGLTRRAFSPPRTVNIQEACGVLNAWDDTGNTQSKGAPLWDRFWSRIDKIGDAQLYRTPFDAAHPIDTPNQINADNPAIAAALGAAVLEMKEQGVPLDATAGQALTVQADGKPISLYGGCNEPGYFTAACAFPAPAASALPNGANLLGNSYMQTVTFTGDSVQAYTLLASGESDDPARPDNGSGMQRYARKDWLKVPFTEREIQNDPGLKVQVLDEPAYGR